MKDGKFKKRKTIECLWYNKKDAELIYSAGKIKIRKTCLADQSEQMVRDNIQNFRSAYYGVSFSKVHFGTAISF